MLGRFRKRPSCSPHAILSILSGSSSDAWTHEFRSRAKQHIMQGCAQLFIGKMLRGAGDPLLEFFGFRDLSRFRHCKLQFFLMGETDCLGPTQNSCFPKYFMDFQKAF